MPRRQDTDGQARPDRPRRAGHRGLVRRLREWQQLCSSGPVSLEGTTLLQEAADEIERLTAALGEQTELAQRWMERAHDQRAKKRQAKAALQQALRSAARATTN